MIEFAHMDPLSGNQDHDDAATRDGQRAGEIAGETQSDVTENQKFFPRPLDRRKLFLFITKVLSENDLYTYLGVLMHQEHLAELLRKKISENLLKYGNQDFSSF